MANKHAPNVAGLGLGALRVAQVVGHHLGIVDEDAQVAGWCGSQGAQLGDLGLEVGDPSTRP